MSDSIITATDRLGFSWATFDPFLFCVHHNDAYPRGNQDLGPQASLAGRRMGMDFAGKDGWSMYHGDIVPGFPQHPHRGFETISLVRQGLMDHADSLGAAARFGGGDCQWMTAGNGVQHSEMFPLVRQDADNPMELFQIWLNLPAKNKRVSPYFTMLWDGNIPRHEFTDPQGKLTTVVTVTGPLEGTPTAPPPPDSWAADPNNEVAVWTIKMAPHAEWTLPAASAGINRGLFFYLGQSLRLNGQKVAVNTGMRLIPDRDGKLVNGPVESELLLLQGRPIGEPVARQGPFVMNTEAQIREAFSDYQRTRFGGWPWQSAAPTHERHRGRFALHPDGREELPDKA